MDEQINTIGNLLQKKNLKNPQSIKRIATEVNDPQTITSQRVVFHIKKEGVLDTSSCVVIPVTMPSATARLPAYQGILGLVDRCVLKTSSGKIIAEQNSSNYLMSIYNHFKDDEVINRRYVIERGVYNSIKYQETDKLGISLNDDAGDIVSKYRVGQTEKVEYQVKLSMLFPQLWPWTIPVFLLDDYLVLEMDFETDQYLTSVGSNGIGGCGSPKIDTTGVKFLSDHIIYSEPTMNMLRQMAQTQKGLSLVYANYSVVNNLLEAPNNAVTYTFRKNIGYAGLRLKHMFIHHQPVNAGGTQVERQKVGGKIGSSVDSASEEVNSQQLNIRINNINYYNEDKPTRELYTEVNDCMLTPLNVNVSQYTSCCADMISADNFYGAAQNTTLRGSANLLGINFSFGKVNGTAGNTISVGNTPVELLYRRTYTSDDQMNNINQRIFTALERILVIRNGTIFNNF